MKKLPCRVVPAEPLKAPLADGDYGLICFNGEYKRTRYGFDAPNPFPWSASIVHFSGGFCEDVASGSSPGDILSRHNVKEVLVIEMPAFRRQTLDAMLARSRIELVTT